MVDTYKQSRFYGFFTFHWLSWLFPNTIVVNPTYLETFKRRSLILFWMTDEERLSSNQIASVRVKKGLFWDTVIIDTKGVNSLEQKGLKKKVSNEVRDKLQMLIESQ